MTEARRDAPSALGGAVLGVLAGPAAGGVEREHLAGALGEELVGGLELAAQLRAAQRARRLAQPFQDRRALAGRLSRRGGLLRRRVERPEALHGAGQVDRRGQLGARLTGSGAVRRRRRALRPLGAQ